MSATVLLCKVAECLKTTRHSLLSKGNYALTQLGAMLAFR